MNTYPKLIAITPLDNFSLILDFGDGRKRLYDFKPNLTHKFYQALADIRLFKSVSIKDGEVEWVTGQDFCPITLYEHSKPI
jgi:hypothetical protein